MNKYTEEQRAAVLAKLMPPHSLSVAALAKETGIALQTLYNWRQKAKNRGAVMPLNTQNAEQWSSADKFAVVLETAALNEVELGEYCRKKGLYVEQIERWKAACCNANAKQQQTKRDESERRWSGAIRNWGWIGRVWLNPVRQSTDLEAAKAAPDHLPRPSPPQAVPCR